MPDAAPGACAQSAAPLAAPPDAVAPLAAPPDAPVRPPPLIDESRTLAYNLDFCRFFDLPRDDGIAPFKEKAKWNQYWYAESTVQALVAEIEAACPPPCRVAYVCTPSLYLARASAAARGGLDALLEIDDESFGRTPGFVRFDLAAPEALPRELLGAFDCVVLDPPLVSADAWALASRAARALLGAKPARMLATTVAGNARLLAELFPGAAPARFLPEIGHLVHQFRAFTTWPPTVLCHENADLPGDGSVLDAR